MFVLEHLALMLFCRLHLLAAVGVSDHGCSSGPGSPPCKKTYYGSGHISATPPPGEYALPTPSPDGVVYPGCMCPMDFGRAPPRREVNATLNISDLSGLRHGEVEILTVDTRVANKIRCNNVSIAEDVAKLLHVPIKRIEVTPWSWALDGHMDVPQQNYLALLQEDHERCDCKTADGKLVGGQGYRHVPEETQGVEVSPGEEVMTVSEYDAWLAAHPEPSTTEDDDDDDDHEPDGPPPARVQMLTRDPCLVQMLRERTHYFEKMLAKMLGLPEDQVIVEPPPVKGTVGLLQLSTRANLESETRQQPFLGIHRCSDVDAREFKKRLHASLLSHFQSDLRSSKGHKHGKVMQKYHHDLFRSGKGGERKKEEKNVEGETQESQVDQKEEIDGELQQHNDYGDDPTTNFTVAANASAYTVNVTPAENFNMSNMSTTNDSIGNASFFKVAPVPLVSLAMKLSHIDYDLLARDVKLVSAMALEVKGALSRGIAMNSSMALILPADSVKMAFYPGSVVVEAIITPPAGVPSLSMLDALRSTACNQTSFQLNEMTAMDSVKKGTIGCRLLGLSLKVPPQKREEEQANRAWIAFWSIVLLPPHAKDAAWHLLNLANTPRTDVSDLLPMTLARVPGLKYRALDEQNVVNETRLPPPEDRAIGFALPNPYDEEAAEAAAKQRVEREHAAHLRMVTERNDSAVMEAQLVLHASQEVSRLVKTASDEVYNSAHAHAHAIADTDGKPEPDIVPYESLDENPPCPGDTDVDEEDQDESPYLTYGFLQSSPLPEPVLHPHAKEIHHHKVPANHGFLSRQQHTGS